MRFPRLELRKAKTALTRPNIGNPDGRGRPGCGWYIEQLVIDEDGWPIIVDGTPGPWPDELSGEHRPASKICRTTVAVVPAHGVAVACRDLGGRAS